ncbi:MAG TPA: DUF2169 domain-containing protein [Polyangium sp.]|nr:DUF2169 domain-containing protein [Polyangium sp.]
MGRSFEHKVALVRQADTTFALAGVVKRTYTFTAAARSRLDVADVQVPLREAPWMDISGPSELLDDSDLVPPKVATDVVVMGHAHAPLGAKETFVSVAVGKMARRLSVIGPRRIEVGPDGTVRFTPTESFTRVPLSPRVAYGGYDVWAQERLDPVPRVLAASMSKPVTGQYAYPRNHLGLGWFVDVDRFRADGAMLPQIEDPADPVLPDKLFVPTVKQWIDAPISASLGWVNHRNYPRMQRMVGSMVTHAPPEKTIRESTFADGKDLLESWTPNGAGVHPRAFSGASPGLAVELLRGDELVILENLHEKAGRVEFALPNEWPVLTLKPPDVKAVEVSTVLQTVRIEPDENRVSLTYCGVIQLMTPALRSFIEKVEMAVTWKRR